jgi:hypothetical protein
MATATAAQILKAQKKSLRKAVAATLSELSPAVLEDQCKLFLYISIYLRKDVHDYVLNFLFMITVARAITTRVLALPPFKRCSTISCYLSMPSGEARTAAIAESILQLGMYDHNSKERPRTSVLTHPRPVQRRRSSCPRSNRPTALWTSSACTPSRILLRSPAAHGASRSPMHYGRGKGGLAVRTFYSPLTALRERDLAFLGLLSIPSPGHA